MNVGIVGLGLMGGSFGKLLKKRGFANRVYGYDHNQQHGKDAIKLGLVDELCDIDTLKTLDIIVLCIPVQSIIKFNKQLTNISSKTTIVDFGSTKKTIIDSIDKKIRENYVAIHPMVGTEKFGPFAAIDNFYENNIVVFCDIENSGEKHLQKIKNISEKIPMKIIYMNATEHDKHACYMSHLPHAISFGLANTVMDHESSKDIVALAGGGFRSMSRIAKSSPIMWSEIFKQNRENLLESFNIFDKNMQKMKKMIEDEDYDKLQQWMQKANSLHDIL